MSNRKSNPVHLGAPVPKRSPRKAPNLSHVDFDQVIHERMRLGILSGLAINDSLTFRDLKQLLSISDGNLSVHARRLEAAEYIACSKSFAGRVPRTEYRITDKGRKALEEYLRQMEDLIAFARRT